MCKIGSVNAIENYFNPGGYQRPVLMDKAKPSLGFSHMKITNVNKKIICEFIRKNSMKNKQNYFDLSKKYFVLFAHGRLTDDLHYHSARVASDKKLFI